MGEGMGGWMNEWIKFYISFVYSRKLSTGRQVSMLGSQSLGHAFTSGFVSDRLFSSQATLGVMKVK